MHFCIPVSMGRWLSRFAMELQHCCEFGDPVMMKSSRQCRMCAILSCEDTSSERLQLQCKIQMHGQVMFRTGIHLGATTSIQIPAEMHSVTKPERQLLLCNAGFTAGFTVDIRLA